MKYWLVKSEPTTYSWERFIEEGGTCWDGVRNFQARTYLTVMEKGDRVLFYHSVVGREVVGIAAVRREAYADPTTDDERWVAVDLEPVETLARPVSLDQIKATPSLADITLLRQSRLSVMPLSTAAYRAIVGMSEKPGPKSGVRAEAKRKAAKAPQKTSAKTTPAKRAAKSGATKSAAAAKPKKKAKRPRRKA